MPWGGKANGGKKGKGKGDYNQGGAQQPQQYGGKKGGGKSSWGPGSQSGKFDGVCRHCGLYGHKLSDCHKLTMELKGKGKGHANYPGGKAGGKGYSNYIGKGGNKSLNELEQGGEAGEDGGWLQQDVEEWETPTWMLGALQKQEKGGEQQRRDAGGGSVPTEFRPRYFPWEAASEGEETCRHDACGCSSSDPASFPAIGDAVRGKKSGTAKKLPRVRKWLQMEDVLPEEALREAQAAEQCVQQPQQPQRPRRKQRRQNQDANLLAPVVRASQVQKEDFAAGWQVMPPPKLLCPLKKPFEQLVPVEVLVDSGAAESVIPPTTLPAHPVRQNAASLGGEQYLTADGKEIPNKGEQQVRFRTDEGHRCALTFQVTDVTKPLLSATQLADTGHEVIFRKTGGVIRHTRTGREIRFIRKSGLYILKMWVEPPDAKDFGRPGVAP